MLTAVDGEKESQRNKIFKIHSALPPLDLCAWQLQGGIYLSEQVGTILFLVFGDPF